MGLPIAGIRMGVAQAGIKYANKDDVTVICYCPIRRW